MENILANLNGITATLTKIKTEQKLNAIDIENMKDKTFKYLNSLSKYVYPLFIKVESRGRTECQRLNYQVLMLLYLRGWIL